MLSNSSVSTDAALKDIIASTAAVMFLGTPHRGSTELADMGDMVRKVASVVLRMDTSAASLHALGLRSTDLERCQDAFSMLWSSYDFRVKTFQEGLGLTSFNLGRLGEKVFLVHPPGCLEWIADGSLRLYRTPLLCSVTPENKQRRFRLTTWECVDSKAPMTRIIAG